MGCVCCLPKPANEVYLPELPPGVIQLTVDSPKEVRDQFVELISQSFCGTTKTAPEPLLSWTFEDPEILGIEHTHPLAVDPSQERQEYFDWLMGFCTAAGERHGGCFALQDPTSKKLVAATVTFPPNDRHLHNPGICVQWNAVKQTGGFMQMPWSTLNGPTGQKLDVADVIMKKAHTENAPGRHLYVQVFATSPEHQGKGYGSKLMQFLVDSADHMKVDAYLETCGSKNETYYSKFGYTVSKRYPIEFNGRRYLPDGMDGMAACVRKVEVC